MMAECSKFYISPLDKMRLSFKCNALSGTEVNVLLPTLNLIIVDLGGVEQTTKLTALNEICTLVGGVGNHATTLDAVNELCTLNSAETTLVEFTSLQNLYIALGGVGSFTTELAYWSAIQQGGLLNGFDVTLTVATEGGDYTSLRAALKTVTDASADKTYLIKVMNGTYNEIDITCPVYADGQSHEYITVQGQSKENTIIQVDGNSTALTPADYSLVTYRGLAINTINQAFKHLLYGAMPVTFKDITLKSKDCVYTAHLDKPNAYTNKYINCLLIKEETTGANTHIFGIGADKGTQFYWEDCTFKYILGTGISGSYAVYVHNINVTPNSPILVDLKNCTFDNCGYVLGEEANTNTGIADIIKIDRCSTNLVAIGMGYVAFGEKPYNWELQISNTVVDFYNTIGRPLFGSKMAALNDYHYVIHNNSGATILAGRAVKITTANNVATATDNDYDYVAFTDIADGADGLGVAKGKAVNAWVKVGFFSPAGKFLKVASDGSFEITTIEAEKVATNIQVKNVTVDGVLKIRLLL